VRYLLKTANFSEPTFIYLCHQRGCHWNCVSLVGLKKPRKGFNDIFSCLDTYRSVTGIQTDRDWLAASIIIIIIINAQIKVTLSQ